MYFGRVDFYTHTHMAHMRWAQTTVSVVIITSRNNHTLYIQCVYAYYYYYNDVTIFCAAAVRGGAVGVTGGFGGEVTGLPRGGVRRERRSERARGSVGATAGSVVNEWERGSHDDVISTQLDYTPGSM